MIAKYVVSASGMAGFGSCDGSLVRPVNNAILSTGSQLLSFSYYYYDLLKLQKNAENINVYNHVKYYKNIIGFYIPANQSYERYSYFQNMCSNFIQRLLLLIPLILSYIFCHIFLSTLTVTSQWLLNVAKRSIHLIKRLQWSCSCNLDS